MLRLITALAVMALSYPALAQPLYAPRPDYPVPYAVPDTVDPVILEGNNTGGEISLTVPRGPNGADTFQSDSAAGGNAGQPSRAVPQGSRGSNGGGG